MWENKLKVFYPFIRPVNLHTDSKTIPEEPEASHVWVLCRRCDYLFLLNPILLIGPTEEARSALVSIRTIIIGLYSSTNSLTSLIIFEGVIPLKFQKRIFMVERSIKGSHDPVYGSLHRWPVTFAREIGVILTTTSLMYGDKTTLCITVGPMLIGA